MSEERTIGSLTITEFEERYPILKTGGGVPRGTIDVGETYDPQLVIDQFIDERAGTQFEVNQNGKWWRRAMRIVPRALLRDDPGTVESDREMDLLAVNKKNVEDRYGRRTSYGMAFAQVVSFPALDVDGVTQIPNLAVIPNVNMLNEVSREYAAGKVDELVKSILHHAHTNDGVTGTVNAVGFGA